MSENIAQLYPARTDTNGRTWYRPVRDKGMGIDQWGWTADPLQAHPDYAYDPVSDSWNGPDGQRYTMHGVGHERPADPPAVTHDPVPSTPTTTEEPMSELFVAGGSTPRTTEWSQYPLPPAPPRFTPKYNGRRQYLMPNPEGGLPTGYSRATTVAKTLDSTYNLELWGNRRRTESLMKLLEHALSPLGYQDGRESIWTYLEREANDAADDQGKNVKRAWELIRQLINAIPNDDQNTTNATIDLINNYNGGQDASEFGTAVHAWLEAIDLQMLQRWQVPDMFKPWVDAYYDRLAKLGFIAVPEYVERVVLNDAGEEVIVGTLDRIYRCVTTGELYLGDIKTSKSTGLQFSWLTFVVQLWAYACARLMMSVDGTEWGPMPQVNQKLAVLMHVPSDDPTKTQALPYNLETGAKYAVTSIKAREHRSQAKYQVPGLTTPVPSPTALRYTAAYQAIQNSRSVDELNAIWEQYQDVWTDDLTALGHRVAALYTATSNM